MTDPGSAAQRTLALLTGQLHVVHHEGGPDAAALRAAHRHLDAIIRDAATRAPIETITSVERLTVGLLLQLAKTTHASPQEMLQGIAVLHAREGAEADPAVALLTARLDMADTTSASAPLDAVRQDLIFRAVQSNPQRTLRTLTMVATALLVALAEALGTTPENLIARLAPYTFPHDH
ncbi:hypothetical protein ACG83_40485 [Frankia sp. R43]|uniref:hypothetical protein n=1 Tax=Frankia sp. R43 TaxID=269536 RepID=UPI0006CA27A1|nr:hypothetical protein [Frankia sp. R43]KPM50406.1 hypothetical protein ACG83_40485 [Frankia sp. R43]